MMRTAVRVFSLFALAVLAPRAVHAQAAAASIAGLAKDSSGAVLPGVTVEAASPALIEKTRSVTTDSAGQYLIINLPPGDYTVTFTLTGFNTVKREGITLSGFFAASVNADMRVGSLEETITVTGATPVVDLHATRAQTVENKDAIRDLPTSRNYTQLVNLVPELVVPLAAQNIGGVGRTFVPAFSAHGGRATDARLLVDGLSMTALTSGISQTEHQPNMAMAQEFVVVSGGGLGEADTSGVMTNLVPQDGGNRVKGSFFANFANGSMQGNNFTDEIKARGLLSPNQLKTVWEVSPTIGGPIIKDKLWYLLNWRTGGNRATVANLWWNKNALDPTKWTYDPDLTAPPPLADQTVWDAAARLTWQVNSRNKINATWDEQDRHDGYIGMKLPTGGVAPEAETPNGGKINRVDSVTWTSPWTNRLLLDAGFGTEPLIGYHPQYPGTNPATISVQEQGGIIPGLRYRSFFPFETNNPGWTYQMRGAVSYVTGSHSFKTGFDRSIYGQKSQADNRPGIWFRLNNGVPNQLTIADLFTTNESWYYGLALFAQDSWTKGRLTLQGGVRYDRVRMRFPETTIGFDQWVPVGYTLPEADGVRWDDVTPRMAGSFDLTGDGKTAIRFTLGKYMDDASNGGFVNTRPAANRVTSVNRSWNDANRDFRPDCNLTNPVANGECGAFSDVNFGKNVADRSFDPSVIYGWGVRPYNWEMSASVQRELLPNLGVTVGYFRRIYGNFAVTDNLATAASDYNSFSVVVPSDPRLPNGGGNTLTNLFDINPAKFGQNNALTTAAANFGNYVEHWNGVDVSVNARSIKGVNLGGGVSTGRRNVDFCDMRNKIPEVGLLNPYCAYTEPFLTQLKGQAIYTVPRIELLLSGTFVTIPGPVIPANFNIPNASIAPSLGRSLAGGAANATVDIAGPVGVYGDRSNELDVRIAKVLTYGGTRTTFGLDIYNVLNANPVLNNNATFNASWPIPTQIMPARFVKIGLTYDF